MRERIGEGDHSPETSPHRCDLCGEERLGKEMWALDLGIVCNQCYTHPDMAPLIELYEEGHRDLFHAIHVIADHLYQKEV